MYHAPYCISRNQNTRSQDAEPGSRDRGEASRILADAASVDNRNVDAASVETREPANAEASAATGGRCVVCFVSAAKCEMNGLKRLDKVDLKEEKRELGE